MNDRQSFLLLYFKFSNIYYFDDFSLRFLSTFTIEIPIFNLPLLHRLVLALDVNIQVKLYIFLPILFQEYNFGFIEKETLLLKNYSLYIFSLNIVNSTYILR